MHSAYRKKGKMENTSHLDQMVIKIRNSFIQDQSIETPRVNIGPKIDFVKALQGDCVRIMWRWREHSVLHAWMLRLYRQGGGSGEFGLKQDVRIEVEDLDDLERDLTAPELLTLDPKWGKSNQNDTETTNDFIYVARRALSDGDHLYYTSWL